MTQHGGMPAQLQGDGEGVEALPLNWVECEVFLWVYGEQLRAVLDHVVLAEYHCRYDWREHKVTDIRDGVFYATRFASPQGSLMPWTPQESLVLYRRKPRARQAQLRVPAQQLWLFELVKTA